MSSYMPSPNMSKHPSFPPSIRGQANTDAIGQIVEDRSERDWCLFIDRDGVINRQVVGDYVRSWQQFEWLPGVIPAMEVLWQWAPHIVIVTNQQGVGKKIMSLEDLTDIHKRMQDVFHARGMSFESIEVCAHLASDLCSCRKPQPGMVLDWLARHPDVDPALSIVVGDNQCDLDLAANVRRVVGACTAIQIGTRSLEGDWHASFLSLEGFAAAVTASRGGR